MKEADTYPWVVAGLLKEGHPVFRIADGSIGKKPFDLAGATKSGIAIGIELKIDKGARYTEAESLPWHLFEMHQRNWLKAYADAGAIALAGVYYPEPDQRLHVWRLSSANDRCDRSADYIMQRMPMGGAHILLGWTELIERTSSR